MKKYSENPTDVELLAEYADYMSKYADAVDKFQKWNSEEMNDAEAAYYTKVQAGIAARLAEVAQ